MDIDPANRAKARALGRKLALWLTGSALVFSAAAAGVLYGIARELGKPAAAQTAATEDFCPAAKNIATRVAPLARGEVAALTLPKVPRKVPDLSFNGPDGKRKTLADFRGRTVLLNLWATWCIPCRAEMPALDKLQATVPGRDFEVVAINIDTARLDKPKAFLAEAKVTNLAYYADPAAEVFQTLRQSHKIQGLPATMLIDKDGCEIGLMAGPADWGSADALALVLGAKGE